MTHASQHACELLRIHEALLRDAPRNRAFHRALKAAVKPGCTVLDIGSGTGVWAVTAAKLGAGKVVAVEMMPMLAGLIRALARDHGVGDRVEVITGDSRRVPLAREFDVVVSETIGHVIFDEQIAEIMIDARERLLKPGGALIPETVALMAAGAHLRQPRAKRLPAGIPGGFRRFESLMLHGPLPLTDKKPLELLTAPAALVRADLRSITAEPPLGNLAARWPRQEAGRLNCFVVWAEMTLGHGFAVSTMDTPSWSATAYRVRPFAQPLGDLEFRLALTAQTNHWSATLAGGGGSETQDFSPELAAAEMLALNAPDPDVFEKMKRLGLATRPPFPATP